MKILIAYGTKYGCTEKCAKILSEKITGTVELCNLKKEKNLDFAQYDKIIIGSSIYMGKAKKEVIQFCENNLELLKQKKIGFFICGMLKDNVEQDFNNSFSQELLKSALAKEFFGGEFKFKKLGPMEKFMVKMVSNSKDNNLPQLDMQNDMSTISDEVINQFADSINNG